MFTTILAGLCGLVASLVFILNKRFRKPHLFGIILEIQNLPVYSIALQYE